ncbi:hypothetical protein BN2497_4901 [Janthinobacterium sp. CG23_2]|nr:hypothetical protein BN2497_4901 [Janthinobacterium sp. CG23_2]CUU28848.1 hypothetical protein BN3177_4901 [Janthinobacterium sp. CG23_2]
MIGSKRHEFSLEKLFILCRPSLTFVQHRWDLTYIKLQNINIGQDCSFPPSVRVRKAFHDVCQRPCPVFHRPLA